VILARGESVKSTPIGVLVSHVKIRPVKTGPYGDGAAKPSVLKLDVGSRIRSRFSTSKGAGGAGSHQKTAVVIKRRERSPGFLIFFLSIDCASVPFKTIEAVEKRK